MRLDESGHQVGTWETGGATGCRPSIPMKRKGRSMKKVALFFASIAVAILVVSGVAMAVEKIGTNKGEHLLGTDRRDILYGRGGNDTLRAFSGNDELIGGSGDDKAQGGPGADELYGTSGSDALIGGDDNDGIYGGVGDDGELNGGDGTDDISGGWGDDVIRSRDGLANDFVSCGPGSKDTAIVDPDPDNRMLPGDTVSPDCEEVRLRR